MRHGIAPARELGSDTSWLATDRVGRFSRNGAGSGEGLRHTDLQFTFEVVDAQLIPYEKHTFNVVIANYMLYHVPDLAKALSEIRRVLQPKGRLYATTVGLNQMAELRKVP